MPALFQTPFGAITLLQTPFGATQTSSSPTLSADKVGLLCVYGAKILVLPVISTNNDSRITDQVVREHFFAFILQISYAPFGSNWLRRSLT